MSLRFNTKILRELDLPSLAKLLLLAMADRASADGKNCCPSGGTLAKETGMARSSVNALLPMLIRAGFVKHTGKNHEKYKTVIYELHLDSDLKKKCARFALEDEKAHWKRINRPPKCPAAGHNDCRAAGQAGVRPTGKRVSGLQHETSPAAGHEVKTLSKDLIGGGSDRADRHHHLPAETIDDEDRPLASPEQTEDEQYNSRVERYRKTVLAKFKGRAPEEFLIAALDIIDERATNNGTQICSARYLEIALTNFLECEQEVADLTDELSYRQKLRDKWMPGFNEQDHSDKPDLEFMNDVRFAIAESERTGREADDILKERRGARVVAP
jgi:hypothetical protein